VEHLGLVLFTTFLYGLRHGIDWDHIAAITDITSTAGAENDRGPEAVWRQPDRSISIAAVRPGWRALFLSTLYVLGHALMVALLGSAALLANTLLPEWVDPILERVVGVTLLLLAAWVFYSLVQHVRGRAEFRLRSRWMLLFSGIIYLWHRLHARLEGRAHGHRHDDGRGREPAHEHKLMQYGPWTAFLIGTIHGIGAETGSQVLLIAAVGGAGGTGQGLLLMVGFIVGLVISNSLLVVLTAAGFLGSQSYRNAYVAVGSAAGLFSLVVGVYFLMGWAQALPSLPGLIGFPAGVSSPSGLP
jgi:ABC-type nickel/cobalt efflux system permease component RcnA